MLVINNTEKKYKDNNELIDLILNYYEIEINKIKEFCEKESHFLIFSLDKYLIQLIKEELIELKKYRILNLDKEINIKTIYKELERKKLTIIYSTKINCIDIQERRIRSRFNYKIIYFPFINIMKYKQFNGLEEEYKIDSSIKYLFNNNLKIKYNLENVSINNLLDNLLAIHFVILSVYSLNYQLEDLDILVKEKLVFIKDLSKFNFSSQIIKKRILELKSFGFFNLFTNRKRIEEVKKYVFINCKLYIKNLFSYLFSYLFYISHSVLIIIFY